MREKLIKRAIELLNSPPMDTLAFDEVVAIIRLLYTMEK